MPDAALLTLAAERVTGVLGGGGGPDVLLARRMQALSLAVHIPIVCFGIAFPAMILFVEGLYLRTGDVTYKALAKRWSKVALTLFAVGVVTGTILSFEFGLLWPDFMATFGEVFGVGFALEGVSFFIEAIFIAIYVYGWDRLGRRAHFLCGIPIVLTGFTGSFWVLGVNAWMNDPTGFGVVDGRVVDPKPWEALLPPNLGHELTHMYLAGYMVAGFVVAGVYATAWLRGRRDLHHRAGLVVALSFAAFAAGAQGLVGDWAGRRVAVSQPTKLAAFEGLQRTQNGAPFTIGGYYDADRGEVRYGIEIPKLLSLLADHDPNGRVVGLDSVPPADRPPVNVVRISFQTMVAIGSALGVLAFVFVATVVFRRRLPRTPWFYRAVIAAGPLSMIALIAGWVATEVGRQPWIVYGVMRTSEAVTRSDSLEIGFAFLIVVYVGLAVAVAWLLRRLARRPPETEISSDVREALA
ncbi:MAG TPA: cytochrome ubiquinol oxidase subunit I [Solirubrobacteraceae bacterium]|nr:cytochrome ubiquinol oxidase subunit I [Solirubrobacteraceae bacterium]